MTRKMLGKDVNVSSEKQLATKVLFHADSRQKEIIAVWANGMLAIRKSDRSVITKGREAILFTAKSEVIIPLLKIVAKEIEIDQLDSVKMKLHSRKSALESIKALWSNRSFPAKIGIGASAVSLMVVGTQGAGIAALGTAIGVPLWIVFGGGATFAAVLYEEVAGKDTDLKLVVSNKVTKNKLWNVLKSRLKQ